MRTVVLALVVAAMSATSALAGMDRYAWRNRPLVVVAPGADHPALQDQIDIAARHAAGFRERDIVVIAAAGDGPVRVDGEPAAHLDAAALRQRFDVPASAFRALLVGKDTTLKLRRDAPIPADTLFRTIDAMPMRQREMRERDNG